MSVATLLWVAEDSEMTLANYFMLKEKDGHTNLSKSLLKVQLGNF